VLTQTRCALACYAIAAFYATLQKLGANYLGIHEISQHRTTAVLEQDIQLVQADLPARHQT